MREVKLRAKATENREWCYGVIHNDGVNLFPVSVDMNTIGWFTGKKDKNGKEIYEGDILIHIYMGSVFKVEYSERNSAFMLIHPTNESYNMGIYDIENCFKVIGNIYDNPELLEE